MTSARRTTGRNRLERSYRDREAPQRGSPEEGFEERKFEPDTDATVGRLKDGVLEGLPFEAYVRRDGTIDWLKKHACVFIDDAEHEGSHKQLWVMVNKTAALHNFHIHRRKFRLATAEELAARHIRLPTAAAHARDSRTHVRSLTTSFMTSVLWTPCGSLTGTTQFRSHPTPTGVCFSS